MEREFFDVFDEFDDNGRFGAAERMMKSVESVWRDDQEVSGLNGPHW